MSRSGAVPSTPRSLAPNRLVATVLGYYLARFDQRALHSLEFTNWSSAFSQIASRLELSKNYIKNKRDIFDPLFEWRRGWWQRPLSPLMTQLNNALWVLSESAMHTLIGRLLTDPNSLELELLGAVITNVDDEDGKMGSLNLPVSTGNRRAITGAAAEREFMRLHELNESGFTGTLLDHRHLGCGYDFLVQQDGQPDQLVEIKGSAADTGQLSFTEREWAEAKAWGPQYWLVSISEVYGRPQLTTLQNPAATLTPRQHFYSVIQVSWHVSASQLHAAILTNGDL